MKTTAILPALTLALLCACAFSARAADKDPVLAEPKIKKAVEAMATADKAAIKDCLAALKKAKKDAVAQLETARKEKMKAGKLDEALAMKKHAEALEEELKASQYFNDEGSTSASGEEQAVCEELAKAQKVAEEACRDAHVEARKPVLALLTEMQETATKADKLDQAVALKARVDGLAEQIEELKSTEERPARKKWADVQMCSFLKHRVVFGEVVSKEATGRQSSIWGGGSNRTNWLDASFFKGPTRNTNWGTFAFCTAVEKKPKLTIDLGREVEINAIFIANRWYPNNPGSPADPNARALHVLASNDGENWRVIWQNKFDPAPHKWEIPLLDAPVKTRWLRLELRDTKPMLLNLSRIEVWSRDCATLLPAKTDGAPGAIAPAGNKPIFGK